MASFRPYDLGCEPSPSVSGEVLLQDGWDAFLLFSTFSCDAESEVAVVECEDCASTRFGYPNDEGLPEHPHFHDGISKYDGPIYYSDDSPWLLDISKQMKESSQRIWGGRGFEIPADERKLFHFIASLKESTFECIATGLTVAKRVSSYEDAFAFVKERFSEH